MVPNEISSLCNNPYVGPTLNSRAQVNPTRIDPGDKSSARSETVRKGKSFFGSIILSIEILHN